jgi:hypothetical protein
MRVQHIDGTLEPPVAVGALIGESEELLDEIGTTFALPDGRWVRVLGFERESEGTSYGVVGQLPEKRTYSAVGNEAYVRDAGEMRMGSPQYGTLILDGSPLNVGGSVDEDTLAWSQDGRYLAATVLDSAKPYPWTKVIVTDAQTRAVVATTVREPGICKPGQFIGRGLEYFQYRPDPEYPYWEEAYLPF